MRTIRTLIIQGLWGKPTEDNMVDDILDVFINIPQTATRKEIRKHIKDCVKRLTL